EFEHPLWRALEERSRGAGHGGMDYIEDYRLIHCLRTGEPLDMDVYDGAAWTAVSELSERSIAERSRSIDFPDFTPGARRDRPPLGIVGLSCAPRARRRVRRLPVQAEVLRGHGSGRCAGRAEPGGRARSSGMSPGWRRPMRASDSAGERPGGRRDR